MLARAIPGIMPPLIEVGFVDLEKIKKERKKETNEKSEEIRKRVSKARDIQRDRFKDENIYTNAEMKNRHIKKYAELKEDAEELLARAAIKFNLSARSYFKMIKVARTIADLDESKSIEVNHIAETLQYRPKITETNDY